MATKKFYAVAVGRTSGIFLDWPSTERQVKGFAGAMYKGFVSKEEAEQWLAEAPKQARGQRNQSGGAQPRRNTSPPVHEVTDDWQGVVVYTDGGSINNPGPGGYGVVIDCDGDREELSGGFRYTTNNRMEMTAAIEALQRLNGCDMPVLLYSDSSYLVNGVNKGWAKSWRARGWKKSDGQPALNIDLWQRLLELLELLDVQFRWVKGHAGNELNERCDQLAVSNARRRDLPVDREYERSVGRSGE